MEGKKDDDKQPHDRWNWSEGELFLIDPDTGERKRLGEIPERIRKAMGTKDCDCAS